MSSPRYQPLVAESDSTSKSDTMLSNEKESVVHSYTTIQSALVAGGLLPSEKQVSGLHPSTTLDDAKKLCREQVEGIVKKCREANRKFRDIEFDLESNRSQILNVFWRGCLKSPSDVQRVTDVYEHPSFFKQDGSPSSEDILQGAIGDCWLLAGLASISSLPKLVEEICVARDEEAGVYGFVFYRDSGWTPVIIDDLLYTVNPKYEELTEEEKQRFQDDKDLYLKITKTGKNLLTYAKSGLEGETWVPLLEKAYAKFYGNYSHLEGGWTGEALEDLTGGVCTMFAVKDILHVDKFWKDGLTKANEDRLFSCSFLSVTDRDGEEDVRVQGLIGEHAYSILRARECKGKKFLVIRNPWGKCEWNGPW